MAAMNLPYNKVDEALEVLSRAGFVTTIKQTPNRSGPVVWGVTLAPVFRDGDDERSAPGNSYEWHWDSFEGALFGAVMAYLERTSDEDNPGLEGTD